MVQMRTQWLAATSNQYQVLVANETRIYGKTMTRTVIEMNKKKHTGTLMANSIQHCCTRAWFLTSARVHCIYHVEVVCSGLYHNSNCCRCESYMRSFCVKCTAVRAHRHTHIIIWTHFAQMSIRNWTCISYLFCQKISLTLVILYTFMYV